MRSVLDEVLVSVFRAPHPTGENVVKTSCHGSNYIQEEVLRLLFKGAQPAKPGVYSQSI